MRKIPLISSSPKDLVHPKIEYLNYPKPGDPIPQLRPVIINLEKTELVKVEESSFRDSWSVQFKHWAADSRTVYVFVIEGHGQLAYGQSIRRMEDKGYHQRNIRYFYRLFPKDHA